MKNKLMSTHEMKMQSVHLSVCVVSVDVYLFKSVCLFLSVFCF